MDLLNMLLNSMTSSSSVNALSQKTGGSSAQTSKLIAAALPILLKFMTQNASQGGAASLLGALSQHTAKRSMDTQISDADEEDGKKIVHHILGNQSDQVVRALAEETQMDTEQVTRGLASLAPALMSGLSAAASSAAKVDLSDGIDFTDLMGIFGGGGQQSYSSTAGLLGSLLGGGAPQQQQSAGGLGGLLGGLLGGSQPQPQPQQSSGGLLGSLLGGGQPTPPPQPQQNSGGLGSILGGVLGGGQPQQQTPPPQLQPQQSSGGLGGLLGGLLGGGAPTPQPQQAPPQLQPSGGMDGLLGSLLGMGPSSNATASSFNGNDLLSLLTQVMK